MPHVKVSHLTGSLTESTLARSPGRDISHTRPVPPLPKGGLAGIKKLKQ